jgi:hypothetical protein
VTRGLIRYQMAGLIWVLAFGIVGILVATNAAAGPALAALFVAATIRGLVALRRSQLELVAGPDWRFQGTPITGDGFSLLEDIDARFAYAERMIDEIPTGIEWNEVRQDVDQLRWDSAGEAAHLSALDVEIHEMRYAERGTPQHAVLNALKERRADHVQILKDNQLEAEKLARAAGNGCARPDRAGKHGQLGPTRSGRAQSGHPASPRRPGRDAGPPRHAGLGVGRARRYRRARRRTDGRRHRRRPPAAGPSPPAAASVAPDLISFCRRPRA